MQGLVTIRPVCVSPDNIAQKDRAAELLEAKKQGAAFNEAQRMAKTPAKKPHRPNSLKGLAVNVKMPVLATKSHSSHPKTPGKYIKTPKISPLDDDAFGVMKDDDEIEQTHLATPSSSSMMFSEYSPGTRSLFTQALQYVTDFGTQTQMTDEKWAKFRKIMSKKIVDHKKVDELCMKAIKYLKQQNENPGCIGWLKKDRPLSPAFLQLCKALKDLHNSYDAEAMQDTLDIFVNRRR